MVEKDASLRTANSLQLKRTSLIEKQKSKKENWNMIRLRCLLGEMQTTMDTTERFEMVLNGPNANGSAWIFNLTGKLAS